MLRSLSYFSLQGINTFTFLSSFDFSFAVLIEVLHLQTFIYPYLFLITPSIRLSELAQVCLSSISKGVERYLSVIHPVTKSSHATNQSGVFLNLDTCQIWICIRPADSFCISQLQILWETPCVSKDKRTHGSDTYQCSLTQSQNECFCWVSLSFLDTSNTYLVATLLPILAWTLVSAGDHCVSHRAKSSD